MNSSRKLQSAFDIQPGEGRLVFLLILQYFFSGIAFTFVQTTAFTMFLTEFDSQKLSLAYIPMAIIVTVLTFIYLQISQRISFSNLLTINLCSLLVITSLFGFGLALTKSNWIIFSLPILFQIVVNFGNLAFWSLAGRIFNVRQGKRLFGLVGAGEWIAIVIMGFLTPFIVGWLGLANLLWLAALGMAGALGTMLVILRTFRSKLVEADATPNKAANNSKLDDSIRSLMGNRYVRLIFGLTLTWWLVFFFLDNIFYGRAAAQYPKGADLAGFLGIYLAILGILTLASNFFLTGPIIKRIGLRMSLLILPIGLAVGTLVMISAGAPGVPLVLLFWSTVITKVWGMDVGFSLDQSTRTILFQPLPAKLRLRVQTFNDGIVQPLATGLAGLALLALNALFSAAPLALIFGLLIVVGMLLTIAILIGREYVPALQQAMTKRRLTEVELITSDATSISILKRGLNNSHPSPVLYSMRMLAEADPSALEAELPNLLKHTAPEVRRHAIETIVHLKLESALPNIKERMLIEVSPQVMGAALRALSRLGDHNVLGYLNDAEPAILTSTIVGLLEGGSAENRLAANNKLKRLANSPIASQRILAAQILGEIDSQAVEGDALLLKELMADADPRVRRAALRSAGRLKSLKLWPDVMEALKMPETRNAAAAALISGGYEILPEIRAVFNQIGTDRSIVLQLTKICGRIGSGLAIEMLKNQINTRDAELRVATLRALNQCGFRAESSQVQEWIKNEAAQAAWISAAAVDIGASPNTMLLQSALAYELTHSRESILNLMSFSGDAVLLARTGENILRGSGEKKAYAMEVIDIQTPKSLKGIVLPILDLITVDERLRQLSQVFPQQRLEPGARMQELMTNSGLRINTWTQACALFSSGLLDNPNLFETYRAQSLDTSDDLIHETAARLQQGANPASGERKMLSTIEKVIILKTVNFFEETSDEILAKVAAVSAEMDVPAGKIIFEKGEAGDSLYIIASGSVCVFDEGRTINELANGEVFGEMALLDPEPRSASIKTIEDSRLLRLDQQALYELIDERPEVARGLLKVLTKHLRNRMRDLADLRDKQPEPTK